MIDYHEALKEMHLGRVVKYVGTVNGNVMTDNGASFCMCRGCIFLFDEGVIKWNKLGYHLDCMLVIQPHEQVLEFVCSFFNSEIFF